MNATVHFSRRGYLVATLLLFLSCLFTSAQDDISDEELDALLADDAALDAWLEEEFSGWDFSSFARVGWGHSDNVLLATVNPQSGDYLRSEFEMFLSKFPDEKGEFVSFLTGTDLRYSGVEDADKEQLLLFDTQWTRYLADTLSGVLEVQYVYFDQILDLSLTERDVSRQRVQYHGYGLGGELELTSMGSNTLTLDFMAMREEYAQVLGNDWLGRVDLGWERPVWTGGKLKAEIRAEKRDYEDRVPRDVFGRPEPEGFLETNRSSALLDLTQSWGKEKNIDASVELKYLENRDNGSGYYDYDQWALDFSLNGDWKGLETSLTLGVDESEFLIQRAERFSTIPREKTDYWAEFFVRKQLMKRISVYLLLEYEESDSNVEEDEYNAFSGSIGFQFDIWGE